MFWQATGTLPDAAIRTNSSASLPFHASGASGFSSQEGKRKSLSENAALTLVDGNPKKKVPKLISPIWDHYTVTYDEQSNRIATCNYCFENVLVVQNKNNTSSVKNHALRCSKHPIKVEHDQSLINFPPVGSKEDASSPLWKFDQKTLWGVIVDKFILDGNSYTEIESPAFKRMAKIGFHPSFKLPGRHTLARSILQRHEDLRVSLKKFFVSKKQRVSLTSDTWTSNQNRNYMSLTAHYIDDKWKLQKKIISFIPITSHGGHDLADYVEGCLREWGIDMVYSITLDNASSNDVMVRELKGTFNRWGTSVLH